MGTHMKTVLIHQPYDHGGVVPYLNDEATLKDYSDVLLISKDHECFAVNKLLLAGCSPMFENIMNDIKILEDTIEGLENYT